MMIAGKRMSDGNMKMGTYCFDLTYARSELAKMIVVHGYSISMVEHKGFISYSNALQPTFKSLSRSTVTRDIIKIYNVERANVMKLLQTNGSRIAITTDMWTATHRKRGYMVVTSHYIDDSWKLQNQVVRFMYVPCLHTAEVLSDALVVECLFEWNIDQNLSTLTVDNYSTNDAMIEIIKGKINSNSLILDGVIFHMCCAAHILNLIVNEGLETIDQKGG